MMRGAAAWAQASLRILIDVQGPRRFGAVARERWGPHVHKNLHRAPGCGGTKTPRPSSATSPAQIHDHLLDEHRRRQDGRRSIMPRLTCMHIPRAVCDVPLGDGPGCSGGAARALSTAQARMWQVARAGTARVPQLGRSRRGVEETSRSREALRCGMQKRFRAERRSRG